MDWRKTNISKLILGTAQLGFKYGISNKRGKLPAKEADKILDSALSSGVTAFDTAQSYQESEQLIGKFINKITTKNPINIYTKLSRQKFENKTIFFESVKKSLSKLQVDSIFGLLVHSPRMISEWRSEYSEWLNEAKQKSMIKYAGVSVYTENDAALALNHPDFDIIQMPLNVFDQRAISHDTIEKAVTNNKLLIFRSIFLQGLLCLKPDDLSEKMSFAEPYLARYRKICQESQIDPLFGAFKFAQYFSGEFPIIVGLETKSQLEKNIGYLKKNQIPMEFFNKIQENFSDINHEKLINPSFWC